MADLPEIEFTPTPISPEAVARYVAEKVAQGWSVSGRDPIRLDIAGQRPIIIDGGRVCRG